MKAVIMAGGEGSRLRPLTCDLPKPMARLCGRPVLEYILDLLGEHGVSEAALTLRYLPGQIIDHFPDGAYGGISLSFVEETSPLGTAGSVKNACLPSDDNILIISGDAMCDFDLRAFAQAHMLSGAAVTILGKRVGDPREYGLIDADSSGRIAGFIEKPSFSQAVSDIANTGIYMLSRRAIGLIPDGKMYDFAKDLFPLLMEKGERLQCFEGQGYWCDIGDLDTYITCQRDMLSGMVKCRMPVGDRARHGSLARINPPVYIGYNVQIGDDAVIEAGSVLDDGCTVGAGARVTGSVLLSGAHIARDAKLTGALVCAGASVGPGAMLFEGTAVGAGAIIGEQAMLAAGVKVWNRKTVEASARVTEHIKLGGGHRRFFDDDGISGQIGIDLTPEFCARVGSAVGSLNPKDRVAVGCSSHHSARVLKEALTAGIQSTGCQVVDFGENFLAQFEFCMNFCAVPLGVFIRGDDRAWIRVLDEGMPATRNIERGIETLLSRGEFVRAPYAEMGDRVDMSGVGAMYRSQLLRQAPGGLDGFAVKVRSRNLAIRNLVSETLANLGCDIGGGIRIELNSQGDRVRMYHPETGTIRYHTILAACATGEMERGRDIALPFDSPRVVDIRAGTLGRRVLRYMATPADGGDREARKLAKLQLWSRDALMQTVMFLHLARRHGGLIPLLKRMDAFDVATKTLETAENPAALLRAVGQHRPGAIMEGILLNNPRGVVLVKPLKRGNGIRIMAESVNAEIAKELCDSTEELLRRAISRGEAPPS